MAFDSRLLAGVGVLAVVVESGNFARAAEALGLTPSGVSRAVARLETRLGVRLFDRTPRAVTLTDEGRLFHAQIGPLLAAIEQIADEAAGAAVAVRGRLRVNVDPWFARLVLAPRLSEFMKAYPALSVELVIRDALGDLVSEGFDVAVRFGEPEPSGLIARKLLETRILTCAAPAYLARHGQPQHPQDLVQHECLLFRDPVTGRPFPWEFHRGGEMIEVKISGRLIVSDLATKLAACAAGHGISQTFALGIDPLLASGELVQILADWAEERFPLYAYLPSRHLPPAKVRAFVDFVLASIARSPDLGHIPRDTARDRHLASIGSEDLGAISRMARIKSQSAMLPPNNIAPPANLITTGAERMDRLTLYGSFTSSSSYKAMLYLALARLPFSFRTVNLKTGVQRTPEYLAVNRWGVVPSLRHRGLTILQSNVILDYLARETGHFEGRTEQRRWQAREWLSWEADHITYVAKVRHSARFRASHPETIAEFRPRAEAALSFVDKAVKDQPFLVGDDCTIADIGCWGRMVFMSEGGFEIANWPHLEAWAERLKAMPGFALPYDLIPSKDREFVPV